MTVEVRKVEQKKFINTPNAQTTTDVSHYETNLVGSDLVIVKLQQLNTLFTSVAVTLLSIRLIFQLFGARVVGIVKFIYTLTIPLVAPFKYVFPSQGNEIGYFDPAILLAIVAVILLSVFTSYLVNIIFNKASPSEE